MSMKRLNRRYLRTALLSGCAAAVAMPAVAQDSDDETGEEIIVTGSRIPNANLTSTSPVTTVSPADFKLAGTTRVEDLLNTLPQLQPGFDAFTVNPSTGTATADLRGLGAARTLVLVNGKRLQPGGIRTQAVDLNQIPAGLIERVEVLTGGASAVYGSDAVAGVVNFVLDSDFDGISLTTGISGYQHNNDNDFARGIQAARGFDLVEGRSDIDGKAYNVDFAAGSSFADGRGHAMAYFTYRKNDEVLQGSRDYSNCALNAAATVCGGSANAPNPNFFFLSDGLVGFASIGADGTWIQDDGSNRYNYAPINHYQRPDNRWTFGSSLNYEVSPAFKPYIETMFANTNTSMQIAESGTFFVNAFNLECDDPLLGSACADLGITPAAGAGNDTTVYVGKRNVEGGPRISEIESNSFRITAGARGDINENWSYDAYWLYGRNSSNEANINDFLTSRLGDAILGCPDGSFDGCLPYNVFTPLGQGVTPEAAAALGGAGLRQGATDMLVVSGYLAGNTGFTMPWAQNPVQAVVGVEYRDTNYSITVDQNQLEGNFTGAGGPRLPIDGGVNVFELYTELAVPVVQDMGLLRDFSLDLGYRYSDYETSGGVSSFKLGATADIADLLKLRGSFNRAIRAANVGELFSTQQIGLFGGNDPCAGATPVFTEAQCANTGVSAAQYGSIVDSPASQYNQIFGGNPSLNPEEADTFTVGLVATPTPGASISIDYYDISISDRIGAIGAQTILNFCGTTGNPLLCGLIDRNASTGDLWLGSTPGESGTVSNTNANFGTLDVDGIDINAAYATDLFGGTMAFQVNGSYLIKQEISPLAGLDDDAAFDCAGAINPSCATPEWRHTARVTFNKDFWTASVRWRHIGDLDYNLVDGTPGTQDTLVAANGGVGSFNYIDVTAGFDVTEWAGLTVGINNIADKEPPLVGSTLSFNANSLGGYDQLGRYLFASLDLRF